MVSLLSAYVQSAVRLNLFLSCFILSTKQGWPELLAQMLATYKLNSHHVITREKSPFRKCIEGWERNVRQILTGSVQHTEIHQKNILLHEDPLTLKRRCQAHKHHHKYLPHSLSITEKQRMKLAGLSAPENHRRNDEIS